jgi:predicted nucleic acid-binding protein
MIVIDASALVIGVTDTTDRGQRVRAHLEDAAVAPHLVDAEVGQALRGLVLRDALDSAAARRSMRAAHELITERYPHGPLASRAWDLRANVSFYDALYVAVAELLDLPLVTADARLAGADGPTCELTLV